MGLVLRVLGRTGLVAVPKIMVPFGVAFIRRPVYNVQGTQKMDHLLENSPYEAAKPSNPQTPSPEP